MTLFEKNNKKYSIDGISLQKKQRSKKNYRVNQKVLITVSILLILIGIITLIFSKDITLIDILKSGNHLILFQNSAELRPTGGFIGSFAELETNNFRIKKLDFDSNIYKRDNTFTKENTLIPSDEVLAEFIPEDGLAMRDSNWSTDFPKAAEEINWFYQKEGGNHLNTLLAVNSEFFKDLLKIIGPIEMVKYDITVDNNNFNEVIQKQVENTYYESEENVAISEPKSILSEMMPIAISRIKKIKYLPSLYNLLHKSLKNKNIQIYSFDPKKEKQIIKLGWGGHIKKTNYDYLYINHANLGANKTSIYVDENITQSIKSENKLLTTELTIERVLNENTYDTKNINFTRIYVPLGSEIISAYENNKEITKNIKIEEDQDKTVFRLWTSVNVDNPTRIKIIYKLPENINKDNYSLTLQKQSGSINQNYKLLFNDVEIKNINLKEDINIEI